MRLFAIALVVLAGLAASPPARAQEGAALFKTYCAICHEASEGNAPSREVLGRMSPEQILQVLEKGAMKQQAAERSRAQRRAIAEYLSGKAFGGDSGALPASAFCPKTATGPATLKAPVWNGWGAGLANARFQPAAAAGLAAGDVPNLKLKWAFGLPGASSGGTQPVVAGGRLYVGDAEGDLFALDAKSGCIVWRFEAEAGIRSAVVLGPRAGGGLTAYFGDQAANMYAADAATGKILWKVRVDDHPQAAITAAAALYQGRLYVPVSSREESKVGDPRYPCCTFRGSVQALDAATGRRIWKTFTIDQPPVAGEKNSAGTVIMGPSGAPVWNTPTIDPRRGVLYVGTGNNYSPPATPLADGVLALDLATGKLRWRYQYLDMDVWNGSCQRPGGGREAASCPDADAPDVDFSSSPVLAQTQAGRPVLVVGNKSQVLLALDPDRQGKVIWMKSVGQGRRGAGIALRGGVLWGLAVAGDRIFVPNDFSDRRSPETSGAMYALAVADGRELWTAPNPPCADPKLCKPSHAAAVTAIPGVVFSGTMDGQFYAYAAADGTIIWRFNAVRDFSTVDGIKANGGSMSNAGATVVGGMVYVNAGYSHHNAIIPGNVLLAFSPGGR